MRIGELAEQTNTSTKTIRYYESLGLLAAPPRAANGYRDYGEEAIERLRFIKDAQSTGLSLTEIGSIVELREAGSSTCQHVIGLLQRHIEQLDDHIEALRKTRRKLMTLRERASHLDPTDCTDPARCQTIVAGSAFPEDAVAALHGAPRPHRH